MASGAVPPRVENSLRIAGSAREVFVVLDDDPAMQFWSAEVDAFVALLREPFASVQTVSMTVGRGRRLRLEDRDDDPVSLAAGPAGSRILFLVSHTRSAAWRTGLIFPVLRAWAAAGDIAVVNVLPQERWHDHDLSVAEVSWSAADAAIPTAQIPWRRLGPDLRAPAPPDRAERIAVPMLERGPDWVARWARLAVGPDGRDVTLPALLIPPEGQQAARPAARGGPDALVREFRATASPQAFELATRLAAAPLNARVMRAIPRTAVRATPAHLTEVLTSTLLRPRPAGSGGDTHIQYEFVYGVRERLLAYAYRDRTIEVQHLVEDALAHDVAAVRSLSSRVSEPRRAVYRRIGPAEEPYLRVELAVHRALGGPNLTAARRLAKLLGSPFPDPYPSAQPLRRSPLSPKEPPMSATIPEQGSPEMSGTELLSHPGRGFEVEGNDVSPMTTGLPAVPRDTLTKLPAIVGNLPLRNPDFTGREALLNTLHRRLGAGTTAVLPEAVHGAGGVGKSQLVVEYVYRHQEDFDLIWWIPAEHLARIPTVLAELAPRLDLQVQPSADIAVPAVLEALRKGRPYSNWLLVFDNAEQPEDVERFFPKGGTGSIVVTSRNKRWRDFADSLPVDVFDRRESIALMQRRDPNLADASADRLAEILGDLPLAIEVAAGWLAQSGSTVEDYIQRLRENEPPLDERDQAESSEGALEGLAAAWNVSLNGLREDEPMALRLLQLCAFFAPEQISRALLSKPRGLSIHADLDPLVSNRARLEQAIRVISRLRLVRRDHRSNSFQMHRLVQRMLIGQMSPEDREAMRHSAHLLLAGNDPERPGNAEQWSRYAELYPHIAAAGAERCLDDQVRELVLNEVQYLWRWGDHIEARNLAEKAYAAWVEFGSETDPTTLNLAFWLGFLHFVVGDYAKAAELNSRTLRLCRETLGDDEMETLRALGAVASDHRVAGDFAGALERSSAVYEQARKEGDQDEFALDSAHNLAVSMRLSGLFGRALRLDEQTYLLKAQIYGTEHPDSLLTYGGINLDRRELGDYVSAHAHQENVVASARKALKDEDHPELLRQSYQLASFRRKAGLHQEALSLSTEVLRRLRQRYGDNHPETVAAVLTVSIDHRVSGDLEAARESGTRAIEGFRALYGDDHPHTAGALSDLAVTMRLLGDTERALELDQEAQERLARRLGNRHASVLAARINLASDHYVLGDYREAYDLDTETLALCRDWLGADHPTTLACGVNLAMDMRGLGRALEAGSLHEEMVSRFRTTLGEQHPATAAATAGVRANCDIDPLPL